MRRTIRCIGFAAAIGIIAVAFIACLPGLGNTWYCATYAQSGMRFVGARSKETRQIEYFSVRVGGHDAVAFPIECPLMFHWRGREYLVRELVVNDLGKMGIQSDPAEGDGIVRAFIGGDDSNRQDYGVEFYFRNGRLFHFYARQSAQNGVACPFRISDSGRGPVAFPVAENQLEKSFGAPDSVAAVPGT